MAAQQVVLTYQPVHFDRLAEGIRGIQRELAAVVETADSDDGLITVTVNARGDLVDLVLNPRVYRTPDSRALAETIARTYRAAREAADRRAFELTARQLDLTANATSGR